jgi:hypothetical protein
MDGQTDSKRRIDRIVYLASLVSEPLSVDVILDKLRSLTATSSQLSPDGVKTLESIQAELEDYLIHKERLRSFTEESLGTNIERHFAADDPVRDAKKAALRQIIATIIIAAIVTGVLAALRIMHGQVVLAFFIFALFAGLALVFQSFKKDLVAQLHGSLNYLMAATVGTGLFALNFPIIAANSYLEKLPLLQHGGLLIAAIPVYVFYYVAFYLYAKQLAVSIPRTLRPAGVVIAAITVAVISIVVPHPVAVSHEIYFDLAVVGFAVSVYLSGAAAVLGFMTVRQTTAVYSKSTLFLAISMVLQTIGNGNFLIFVTFMSGDFSVNDQKGQILTAFLIMCALASQYIAAYKSKTSLR